MLMRSFVSFFSFVILNSLHTKEHYYNAILSGSHFYEPLKRKGELACDLAENLLSELEQSHKGKNDKGAASDTKKDGYQSFNQCIKT